MGLTNAQKTVISDETRFRVLISGRRFGKTYLAISELARFARFPNKKVWYVAPTYRQAKSICWSELKQRLDKVNWISKINNSDLSIELVNGSTIALRGADNEQSLRGIGLDFLCMDEFADIHPSAWFEVLRPTLSDKLGSALFCGTPRGFGNWAYDLYSKGLADKEWKSFQFSTLDGEQVSEKEIDQAKDDLDERTFQQEYLASFVNYSGMIYYNFDRNKNIINEFNKNFNTLWIGLDFNVDPMAAVVCVVDNFNLYVVDEIQIWSSNTFEMVQEIKDRYNYNIKIFPDPAARQRKTSAGGLTDLAILKNAGFNVFAKSKAPLVRDRINSLNTKLQNANGIPSLFILNSCKNVIKSLERQIYKEGTNIPDKDSGFDHFNDALGYLVDYMFPLRRDFKPSEPKRWS
jgi:hypothetical protein|tara:strand:+ start:91 stop:1305 length:1215 start_codon:yes stop_codon:yes gene_type:complete